MIELVEVDDASVTAPAGFRAGAAAAGIKAGTHRLDVAIVAAVQPCAAHAVFTRSRIVAAPVIVSRERIAGGQAQGIVINAGNANAATGAEGIAHARAMADLAAAKAGIAPEGMLVASTGLIGWPLPMDRVRAGIERIQLSAGGGHDAARAILTTDTRPKEVAVAADIGGRRVTVAGMAKGSGMIHPDLATLLAVLTTDAALEPALARTALQRAVDASFNQVSVDRDTSTNDMVLLLASGASGGPPIRPASPAARLFALVLEEVCVRLARLIARDGEGATRLIEAQVEGAASLREARRVARAIVASNLVKAAVFGQDPNWGRVMMAVGNAGVSVDPDRIDIFIGGHQVARNGAYHPFDPQAVAAAMGAEEVQLRVCLHQGGAVGRAWGCDLTEEYVKINAEYST